MSNETYGDEEIVEILNQYKKSVKGDIKSGFSIAEDLHRFKSREVVDGKVKMSIPIRFDCYMGQELRKINQFEDLDKMYISSKGEIQISVKLLPNGLNGMEISSYIQEIERQLPIMNTSVRIYERDQSIEVASEKIVWFDYKVLFGTTDIYIMFFAMEVYGDLFYGKFSCSYRDSLKWKEIFIAMLETVQICQIEGGNKSYGNERNRVVER